MRQAGVEVDARIDIVARLPGLEPRHDGARERSWCARHWISDLYSLSGLVPRSDARYSVRECTAAFDCTR